MKPDFRIVKVVEAEGETKTTVGKKWEAILGFIRHEIRHNYVLFSYKLAILGPIEKGATWRAYASRWDGLGTAALRVEWDAPQIFPNQKSVPQKGATWRAYERRNGRPPYGWNEMRRSRISSSLSLRVSFSWLFPQVQGDDRGHWAPIRTEYKRDPETERKGKRKKNMNSKVKAGENRIAEKREHIG